MRRKRLFAAAACAAAVAAAGPGSAFAGEITGSGKGGPNGTGTPGGTLNASSACAFSGLEDGAATPGTVQNYGHRADDPFFGTVVIASFKMQQGNKLVQQSWISLLKILMLR